MCGYNISKISTRFLSLAIIFLLMPFTSANARGGIGSGGGCPECIHFLEVAEKSANWIVKSNEKPLDFTGTAVLGEVDEVRSSLGTHKRELIFVPDVSDIDCYGSKLRGCTNSDLTITIAGNYWAQKRTNFEYCTLATTEIFRRILIKRGSEINFADSNPQTSSTDELGAQVSRLYKSVDFVCRNLWQTKNDDWPDPVRVAKKLEAVQKLNPDLDLTNLPTIVVNSRVLNKGTPNRSCSQYEKRNRSLHQKAVKLAEKEVYQECLSAGHEFSNCKLIEAYPTDDLKKTDSVGRPLACGAEAIILVTQEPILNKKEFSFREWGGAEEKYYPPLAYSDESYAKFVASKCQDVQVPRWQKHYQENIDSFAESKFDAGYEVTVDGNAQCECEFEYAYVSHKCAFLPVLCSLQARSAYYMNCSGVSVEYVK